ncbi:MAG TPA: hypothetical protein VG916_08155 [Gemmatimonadaceae bacterium]|nr:hypothetical protein [Gemmatimonadaceae bacterium]
MEHGSRQISRRRFVALGAGSAALAGFPWARSLLRAPATRLSARPATPGKSIDAGLHQLGIGGDAARDALVYVPASYDAKVAAPLIVGLHGATQAGQLMTTRLQVVADALGAPVLAPDSRGVSWDAIRGDFGVDVEFIDHALAWAFDRVRVDARRVWLAGFSDGASYGLSLGIANGGLFSRVLAFSPGFVIPTERRGKPRFFVSHGRQDPILPIDRCSRIIVPRLRADGYDVRFDEFDGGHRMPPEILAAATKWLTS